MLKVYYHHQIGLVYLLICSASSIESSTTPLTSSTSVPYAKGGLQLLLSLTTLLNSHLSSSAKILAAQILNFTHFTLEKLIEFKCPKFSTRSSVDSPMVIWSRIKLKTMITDNSLTVLNPFTRAEVPLPFNRFHFFTPLHIGADPIRNSDDVVIYMINSGHEGQFVGFWKNEDNKWALQRAFVGGVEAYLRGRLCFTNYKNNSTTMMDLTTRNKLEVKLPCNNFERSDFFCLG